MSVPVRLRRGAVVAAVALAALAAPCLAGASVGTVPVAAPSATGTSTAPSVADPAPSPTPGASAPTDAEVSEAQEAAAAAAREVAEIKAEVARAEARLRTLQRAVADAVAAHERAEQQLTDADAAMRRATTDLAAARRARAAADRALSAQAALMYMQGGDLQNLTTLLLSPPGVMSDLSVVLDQGADRARDTHDDAASAAVDAAARERLLVAARDRRAAAAQDAGATRATAEKEAVKASTEAARLGQQQEVLTARLDELEEGAAELVNLREEAARLSAADLLGVQGAASPGSAPRAAQEIARSMMADHGWDEAQFACLVELWHAESGWSWSATNVSSGAYGIPQSLPGWKMASAGSDWLTNPATQITWGLGYIESVYGSPCAAHERFLSRSPHWY